MRRLPVVLLVLVGCSSPSDQLASNAVQSAGVAIDEVGALKRQVAALTELVMKQDAEMADMRARVELLERRNGIGPVDAGAPRDLAPYPPGVIGAPCDASSECIPVDGAFSTQCQADPDRPGGTSCCFTPTNTSATYCHPIP